MAKLKTTEDIANEISQMENGEYKLISDYISSIKPITIQHSCGTIVEVKRAKSFIKEGKNRCPNCKTRVVKSTSKLTQERFIERLKSENPNDISIITKIISTKKPVTCKCNVCNNVWDTTPDTLLNKKSGCPKCGNDNRGKYNLTDNYLENMLVNGYTWLEDYKGDNKLKHQIKHDCGHVYGVRPNDFQQGYRCPVCNPPLPSKSKACKIFEEYATSMNIKLYPEVKLGNLFIDYVIISNGYKIMIEIDGEQHFSNKTNFNFKNDWIKNNYAAKTDNVILIRLSTKNIYNKSLSVKNILQYIKELDINKLYELNTLVISKDKQVNRKQYYLNENLNYFNECLVL